MRELRQLIQTVAVTDARVLVLGESGTGKELVAGAVHTLSRRQSRSYVRINCAAIPETLLESELFGHEKGAFTGAFRHKSGRVEEAHGGTIFLDEIADMGKPLQAKLLRFLEDGTFTRVGGTEELRVDVRLIAATNRDIVKAMAAGDFREDLFHRLNVVQFNLPPLRERGDDIVLLAEHFLTDFPNRPGQTHHRLQRPGAAKTSGASLAGQCARAAQRRGARLDFGNQPRNSTRQPARLCHRVAPAKGRAARGRPGRVAGRRAGALGTRLDPKYAGTKQFQPDTRRRMP